VPVPPRGYDPSMDLTPELLRTVEFNDAKKGGYDHDEVDEFLDRAAADLARQQERIRELEGRISAAERRADEAETQAKDHSDSDETLRRTLVLAQRTADAAIKEAQDDAARLVGEARQKADGMIASAEEQVRREVGATRDRLQAEIRELEGRRAELHERISELGGHLDAERDRIGVQLDRLRESLRADSMAMGAVPAAAPSTLFEEDATDGAGSDDDVIDLGSDLPRDPDVPRDTAEPSAPVAEEPAGEDLSDLPPPPEEWASSSEERFDDDAGGPPTEATPVVDLGNDVGSAHLDELRRAVSDGPTTESEDDAAMAAFFDQDDDDDDAEPGRRFGRRR
jgi:DivIVA domain-containing protein